MNKIILSGNCFWCVEALYQRVKGITRVVPGHFHFTTLTGRVEAVMVEWDSIRTLEDILDVFFVSHNPNLVDWQDCVFPLNRSAIMVTEESQKKIAQAKIEEVKTVFEVVHTKVLECGKDGEFIELPQKDWNFFLRNPKDDYCVSIIEPKLDKLKMKLSQLYKC